MSKTLSTLVEDIYTLMKNRNVPEGIDAEAEIEKFGEAMKALMRKEFLPNNNYQNRKGLRLSSIGKPERVQWFSFNKWVGEKIQPHTFVKFMYGNIIEEMLLFLTRMSGHEVTDEQKVCEVKGVKGHMDCKIDGVTVDVKSTSTYGFKKFKDGTLAADDPFGYIPQAKAYAHSEGERKWAYLAMDKQNGHLCVLNYDLDDTKNPMYNYYNEDIEELVERVKKSVEGEELPSQCSKPIPDGKSGNLKLSTICSYCQYKKHCYPELKAYAYSTGPRFLSKVVNPPNVQEINLNAII